MFAEERQNAIVELVNENGAVKVKDLSLQFHVTEDSIRKDLTRLEKKGLLKKRYGGAVKIRINPHDVTVHQRKEKHIVEKQRIAKNALHLIEDEYTIYLDISTANLELAKLLIHSDKKVTVVTNMVDVMLTLAHSENIKVIFIGGTLNRSCDGFVGSLSEALIRQFRFDLSFMGVVGMDVYGNSVDTYVVEDGMTKKVALAASKKAYLMLECRKLEMDGTYKYAKVDDFVGVIMDEKPKKEYEEKLLEFELECYYQS
ncbi:DeoR/GlpR family DNA-binding transcription regulator [Eubacterium barkeri]|uniref:Transcriptional regulator, DeoR family n=1 Tax=Eubacterium barkeri TaxID=1528 RepID=A0A1H3JLN6_EUBBA|nr:DeoR/GlpR family DNA-binding transcription regulator [Eubacterium barkeri]SDY40499.1 transcriptional regulator, DeoR family [Eubacterium barkeri]